ncbi:Uma2 family endonuclease [Kitasatospora paranensis]
MTAGPDMVHNVIVASIQHQVPYGQWRALTTQDLTIPGEPSEPQPDLVVFERGAVQEMGRLLPSGAVTLVVEVVSKTSADRDHRTKRGMYAAGGIPAYLIVDPLQGECTLLTEPTEENAKGLPDYLSARTSRFGAPVPLDVLGVSLDTSEFQVFDRPPLTPAASRSR